MNGNIVISPNFEGIKDTELNVIHFITDNDKTKAVWFHYACHPVNSSENRLSSEYCGVAAQLLERHFGGEVIAGFMQGCCGDINPFWEKGARGLEAINEVGRHVADAVREILNGTMVPLKTQNLQCVKHTAELPFRNIPTYDELSEKRYSGSELEKSWSEFLMKHPERLKPSATLELSVLVLAENLNLLFLNGEIVIRYGLFVKEYTGGRFLPVAYSNGLIGYVTTAEQLLEGGYEPIESVFYIGLPAPFDLKAESIILEKMKDILNITSVGR